MIALPRLFGFHSRRAAGVTTRDATGTALVASGLRKVYRSGPAAVEALRGIDLRIQPGEHVAIMGPSGSGKTTLLNCLAGLEGNFEGEIWLAGSRLKHLSEEQRARLRARSTGYVFQTFNLLPTLSALENVEMPLLIAGVRGRAARARAREMLTAVGLGDRLGDRPANLSGGQQQRVAIARALVNRPAIVFADEPTGNLDSDTADEIMGLIAALNRELSQTFVVVTHAAEIARRAARLIRMRDGRIVTDTSASIAPSEIRPSLDPAAGE